MTKPPPLRSLLALALVAACSPGAIADPSGSAGGGGAGRGPGAGTGPLVCGDGAVHVSARPLRRLTPEQYTSTVRDLTGDASLELNVDDGAIVLTERGVRQLRDAAEAALARRDRWTASVFPCDIGGSADDACASAFIDGFVTRAFRRPVTPDEREWLLGVYGDAKSELGFRDAMEVLLSVVLQSPQLVYVSEIGVEREGLPPGVRALTDYELAARLSYFLLNTTPDDALLDAAARGQLAAGSGLRDHAERLLADPRAEATVQRFFWQWLQLDGGRLHHPLEESAKDSARYPEYDDAMQAAMRTELEAFVRRVFADGGSFEQLLTDRSAYVNGPLAELYGVSGGPASASEWQWVELDGDERAGLLTRAAFLTVFSAANVQSPIRRGVFVLEEVLCQELGEPPPNASDVPVEGGEVDDGSGAAVVRSVRDDVEARTSDPQCASCHSVINPVGFVFEHYDAIGRWQDDDPSAGTPIDSTGRLAGTDVDGPVADARALSEALARSERVRECFADRWLVRALGQPPGDADACTQQTIRERFVETGSVRELLVAIVESDAFRYLAAEEEL